jgi:hypothetical protein
MLRSLAALVTLLALLAPAHAEGNAAQRTVSLTVSPLHLLSPELHLTVDLRLAPKVSAAASVGAGTVTEEGESHDIWGAGAQFRYYVLGSFTHGMMLGADVGYVDVSGEVDEPMAYLVGVRAGAFLGYKIAMKAGFTTEAQVGPVYVRESESNSEWQTLLNLNVGWSW